MAQLVLSYNTRNLYAKRTIAYLSSLSYFKIVETDSPYDPEFVKKIERGIKSEGKKMNVSEIWN
jgi:hypothetical protein